MSNHDGSYILNEVLILLDEYEAFKTFGKEKTLAFLTRIREIGWGHDCNIGEILSEIGEKLKVCYECLEYREKLLKGRCEKCRVDEDEEDDDD